MDERLDPRGEAPLSNADVIKLSKLQLGDEVIIAKIKQADTRPRLVIRSEHDPKSYYYLARLDVNDEDDNNRSLKIEQKASGFTATTRAVPAGRWHVEYEASEPAPGTWHITPAEDLMPGEYGVVSPGGILYEFGID